jgi:hypothetical protein
MGKCRWLGRHPTEDGWGGRAATAPRPPMVGGDFALPVIDIQIDLEAEAEIFVGRCGPGHSRAASIGAVEGDRPQRSVRVVMHDGFQSLWGRAGAPCSGAYKSDASRSPAALASRPAAIAASLVLRRACAPCRLFVSGMGQCPASGCNGGAIAAYSSYLMYLNRGSSGVPSRALSGPGRQLMVSSILRASSKSLSVMPFAVWVMSLTMTKA